jgi:hypothetical protein
VVLAQVAGSRRATATAPLASPSGGAYD